MIMLVLMLVIEVEVGTSEADVRRLPASKIKKTSSPCKSTPI
jgi:hypothetical protein